MSKEVEIWTSARDGKTLHVGCMVMVRIGSEVATMTAGEWSRLIANPKRADIVDARSDALPS